MKVSLTPELHYGPSQLRWSGGEEGMDVVLRQHPMREREVFESTADGRAAGTRRDARCSRGLPDSDCRARALLPHRRHRRVAASRRSCSSGWPKCRKATRSRSWSKSNVAALARSDCPGPPQALPFGLKRLKSGSNLQDHPPIAACKTTLPPAIPREENLPCRSSRCVCCLDHAAENDYGLAAFNVNNMEQIQAIMEAAKETDSPVIVQASRGARSYSPGQLPAAPDARRGRALSRDSDRHAPGPRQQPGDLQERDRERLHLA